MRYFQKVGDNINVMPMVNALMRHPELWDQDRCRTTFDGTPHAQVSDVLLRFGSKDGNDLEAVDRPTMALLPGVKATALALMYSLGGSRLGRMIITRTEPGKSILPHTDTLGDYASYYSRYHIVLQGLPGSLFGAGDETVQMLTGEVWWFDAHAEHWVKNNSGDDRIHLLVDIRVDD